MDALTAHAGAITIRYTYTDGGYVAASSAASTACANRLAKLAQPNARCPAIITSHYPCVVKALLTAGADPSKLSGGTRLLKAMHTDQPAVLRMLLAHPSVIIDARYNADEFGPSYLVHVACFALSPDCMCVLLEAGADVSVKDAEGLTPLQMIQQPELSVCVGTQVPADQVPVRLHALQRLLKAAAAAGKASSSSGKSSSSSGNSSSSSTTGNAGGYGSHTGR